MLVLIINNATRDRLPFFNEGLEYILVDTKEIVDSITLDISTNDEEIEKWQPFKNLSTTQHKQSFV